MKMKAPIPALKGRHIITQGFIPVYSGAPVGAAHLCNLRKSVKSALSACQI